MASYSEQIKKERQKSAFSLIRRLCFCMVMLIVLAVAAKTYLRQDQEMERLRREQIALERELSLLEAQAYDLEEQEAQVGSSESLERIARDKLGLVKSDELIFIE
ncbi:MAG: septum formation initiator family protein [Eubacteriales bacterium]|nr:septum formation initiator family protein [Eubacteriales bacterium]